MALDSVHYAAVDALLGSLDRPDRRRSRRELGERIWSSALADPSTDVPVEPIEPPDRRVASVDDLALESRPFDRVAAVDAGSLNPTTFENGLVVDLAQAALGTTPSDVDRHRARTIVSVVHGPPAEVRSQDGWSSFDEGYGRSTLVASPTLDREEDTAVHTLALETAEVEHALAHLREGDELALMDGSVFPASVLHWDDRGGSLRASLRESREARRVLSRSVELVTRCRDAGRPILGVVKNWTARGLLDGLGGAAALEGRYLPWPGDLGLFRQLLVDLPADEEPALRWTTWFTMDFGVGAAMRSIAADQGVTDRDDDTLRLAFMVVYDPRRDLVFRVEAPAWVVEPADRRGAVTEHVLAGIATNRGPPPTLEKADALARVGRGERQLLRRRIARALDTTPVHRYDDVRWAAEPEAPRP